jgi:protoheme IX farnesyltransferase
MRRMTRLYRSAFATVLATFALIAIGGIARLHPAGAGCGYDWPRCNGSWLPALAWEPLVAYLHRVAALAVIVLAIGTALLAYGTAGALRRARFSAAAMVGAILVQSAIGGATAVWGAPAGIAFVHLLTAMVFLACASATLIAVAAARGEPAWLADLGRAPSPLADRKFALVASAGAAIALVLVVFGASTSATGAFACAAWPLCGERASDAQMVAVIHLGYRATALLGTLAAAVTAVIAWRAGSRLARLLAGIAVGLVALQTGLNALAAGAGDPAWISAPHLLIASLFWIAMLGIAAAAWGPRPVRAVDQRGDALAAGSSAGAFVAPSPDPGDGSQAALALAATAPWTAGLALAPLARARQVAADYLALTKPGIISLLLTTTLCAMLAAARGIPPFWLVAVTMLGGALASGGANALNCYIDRDIDGRMTRTRHRAIVAGRITPDAGLAFGIALSVGAILLLGLAVNWTAAGLALAGNLYYVFVYTLWLKRATPYNIVIGGAAGAVPPLVGWAAVTGDLSPLAWGLFAIVFAWTPPHSWALALLKQGEYTRAEVPMLPVARGEAETRRQIVIYTALLTVVCLALAPLGLGGIYLVAAAALNGVFLWLAVRLLRQPSKRMARQMFFYSLWYLALMFAAVVIDRIVIS